MNITQHVEIATGMRFQWEPAQSVYVLLYPEGMVQLNRPAGEILSRCDGRTIQEIVKGVEEAFGASGLEADVVEFLEDAVNKGWITTRGAQ